VLEGVGEGRRRRRLAEAEARKVRREAGITLTRTEGVYRFISLRRDDLEARFPGLLPSILKAAKKG
jgi:hypothetical protein